MNNKAFFIFSIAVVLIGLAFIPTKQNMKTELSLSHGSGEGIQFIDESWSKILELAKKENKLIFLDAYASWCGPCKQLKKKTFPDKYAGDFFNKNFINVAVDMEKGEGPKLGTRYKVSAYPTLIIISPSGNIVTYTQGYINAKQLIEFGKYGLAQFKK